MGWCQSFGPQIKAGCDHSMVAGPSSCSCPECGVVCEGRFAGCSTVWADGPQLVEIRRPSGTDNPRQVPQLGASNGRKGADTPLDAAIARPVPLPVRQPTDAAGDDDLQVLIRGLLRAIETLPARIASAAGEAMRQQHLTNRRDLESLWRAVAADADQIGRQRNAADDLRIASVTVEALDERFEWLVDELSKRFVAFGNELVRIERRLPQAANGKPRTNGSPRPYDYSDPTGRRA